MAKKKETNFVSFNKIGDKVEGKIVGFSTGVYGLVIELDNKKLISANKTQLMNIIKDNRKLFKSGVKLLIKFIDEKKVKGQKNKAKIFFVSINGKELKAEKEFIKFDSLSDKSFNVLFS